ncbi:MAG: Short-chain dehydrogenase [Frondihabitans sp.]|nr:Short-chain dehydrogenase [Frondihabitans sp.]
MPKTIVITGATSGLGRLTANRLAGEGTHLVLAARSQAKADETRSEILTSTPGARVDIVLADLTRMADVRRLGTDLASTFDRIDVLVNNAGIHAFEQRTTADGYPEMVAVNYLAPWLLTRTLLPTLIRTPGARIVNVASEASRRHGTLMLPADLTDTVPFTARQSSLLYGKTKLLGIMFTLELARRLAGTGVTANCLDPGFNVTGLGRELRFAGQLERLLSVLRIGDPRRGADLIAELAIAAEYEAVTGAYITRKNNARIEPAPPGSDPILQTQLWAQTEQLLNDPIEGDVGKRPRI